ncbi:hypothetical protein WICPIJ_008162 [Wickerhamomyces pijperi]|uniref:Carnitine O-acetyltransferase, mitochondrial n=1 Tax=Wickerhamomyces pijperi TaxID=599730 RepID=A0A9P8PZY4_WICPI|nr:hypothetical protein WICPIJ_008162 [Wickerhamomyces pijperi]
MLLRNRLISMTTSRAKFSTSTRRFKGETFKYQESLPSLPVPTIEATKARYLKSIKPYTSAKEYTEHEALVADFFDGQGKVLHERLTKLQSQSRNWLAKYWDDYAYLQYNDPVVPYVSYFYGHKSLPAHLGKIDKNQFYKSIAVIEKVLDFVELIKNESLPAEVIKGTPYCMQSFQRMFNNSRIPSTPGQDSNVFHSIHENGFIIVMVNNHFFKLTTHTEDGERLSTGEIYKQFIEIANAGYSLKKGPAIGLLTTLPRDQYYEAYQELNKYPSNIASFDEIFRSTFILTLEDDKPITYEERAHFSWHGSGENRFFDKPIQFFIARNGYVGFIAEHSKMDGTPTLLLNEFVNRELRKLDIEKFLSKLNIDHTAAPVIAPKKLNFQVSPSTEASIEAAKANFKSEMDNHDVKVWHYNKYGKNIIKTFKTSPDAFIQMIIQLAHYKLTGKCVPTYEAASTRKFFGGRTEATRSVSEESLRFVRNWEDPTVSDEQRAADFKEACNSHIDFIKNASNGEGVDRHFLGLKFQLESGEKPHALFSDPLFNYSSTWLISTSQLSSNFNDAYGWSEVNPIGWGLAYQINNDFLHINICTKRSSGNKSEEMWYCLSQAADEIFEVLIKAQTKPKL